MPSALLPCTKIPLDHMAPFMRYNWASMSTTRRHYTSKGYTTLEKLVVWKNSTFSVKCLRKDYVSDVVSSLMNGLVSCRHRTGENLIRLMQLVLTSRPLDATDDEEQIRQALQPLVHNRDGHFLATLSAIALSVEYLEQEKPEQQQQS